MYCHDGFDVVLPVILLKTSLKGMETEPKLIFTKKHSNNTIVRTINDLVYVLLSNNYSNGLKKNGL